MSQKGARDPDTLETLQRRLFQPVDIASIVYFRIVFGAMMVFQIVHEFSSGNAANIYVKPRIHFSYFGFDWLPSLPGTAMYTLLIVLAILGACIALGFAYRMAITLFFVGFTYLFLLDKAAYQNHLYLICLISFLMMFIPAHRSLSIDTRLGWTKRLTAIPAWTLWILVFQFGVVYLFGGIAKINPDWLNGQPVGLWLSRRADWPVIGRFVHEAWFVGVFEYGGLLFDLFIVPALLWKRTRVTASLAAVAFHLINDWIFTIGIFPWLMILTTPLFFESDWPRKAIAKVREIIGIGPERRRGRTGSRQHVMRTKRPSKTIALLGVYAAIQLVVPLRHYLYPGDANWTEEGHHFSWHMMLRYKEIDQQQIVVKDADSQRSWPIRLRDYMDFWQARNMLGNPDMLLQFCHFLASEKRREGVKRPQVFALVQVGLNGRPPQPLVDPSVDLAAQPRTFKPKPWILPLSGLPVY